MFRDSNASIQAYPVDSRFSADSSSTFRVHQSNPRFSAESSTTIRQTYNHPRFSIESFNTYRQRHDNSRDSATSTSTDKPHHIGSRFSSSTIRQHYAYPRFRNDSVIASHTYSSQLEPEPESLTSDDRTDEIPVESERKDHPVLSSELARTAIGNLRSLPASLNYSLPLAGLYAHRDSLELARFNKSRGDGIKNLSPIFPNYNSHSATDGEGDKEGLQSASSNLETEMTGEAQNQPAGSESSIVCRPPSLTPAAELFSSDNSNGQPSETPLHSSQASDSRQISSGLTAISPTRGPLSRLLSEALAHANIAVLADNQEQTETALSSYVKAIEALQDVRNGSTDPDNRRKVATIMKTYSARRMELLEEVVRSDSSKSSVHVNQVIAEDRRHELLLDKAFTTSPVVDGDIENGGVDDLMGDLEDFMM